MNEHYENYDMDEMEIDLIDFLFYLLRRWKSLVAMILLGAILGSAFCVVKTTKSSNAAVEDYQPDADTEANMKLAAQYRRLYDQQMDYNEHSIVMQMDPNQVYEGTLTYYLAAGEQTERLAQLFTDIVNDPAVLEELKEVAGLDCEDQYVKELVSSTTSQKEMGENSDLTAKVVNNLQVTGSMDSMSNTVITYQVVYLNQEICEKMVTVLQNAVVSAAQKYVDTYGEYEFEQLQNVVAVTVDEKYLEKQKTSVALVDGYLTKLTTLEGAFNDTEMVYYQGKYLAAEHIDSELSQKVQNGIAVKNLVKWLIIGGIGFIVLWAVYYFLKYLLDPSIKTLNELEKMKLPIIGSVKSENTYLNFVDNIRRKGGYYISTDYIAAVLNKFSENQILICREENPSLEKLGKDLTNKLPNIKIANWIQMDVDILKQEKQIDGMVLVISLGKTPMRQLQRELEICKIQKIKLIGIIGVIE